MPSKRAEELSGDEATPNKHSTQVPAHTYFARHSLYKGDKSEDRDWERRLESSNIAAYIRFIVACSLQKTIQFLKTFNEFSKQSAKGDSGKERKLM